MYKMKRVRSYVFFDLETTGLPWLERNRTKITELSFVATSRRDILSTNYGDSPPVSKLTLVFNPLKAIHPEAVKMTGLSNDLLKHSPTFDQKVETIVAFLQDLPAPVCLIAHNGNRFDYKILLAEFNDANASIPDDLLCVDSLIGFKTILKNTNDKYVVQQPTKPRTVALAVADELFTDDEDSSDVEELADDHDNDDDDWPHLNASTEEWQDIDKICDSLSDMSCEELSDTPPKRKVPKKQLTKEVEKKNNHSDVQRNLFNNDTKPNANGFTLVALYENLLKKKALNSHRAEGDCLMLLQCVVATKDQFMPWADEACKALTDIQPLIRQ